MEDEKVITNPEVVETETHEKDNSVMKGMRTVLKEKDAIIKDLEDNSVDKTQFEALQRQVDEGRVEKLYGQDNVEEALQLEKAGFDETKIKQFLKKSDMPTNFQNDPAKLGLELDNGDNNENEETEEARNERLAKQRVLEEKENAKHSI